MSAPTTPRSKTLFNPVTPTTTRTATAHIVQSSPHYTTTRRHSLYGVEDRVVIDPGSRIWKVGFSGEGRPRDVFYAAKSVSSLWMLRRAADVAERAEEDKILEVRVEKCFRSVFHDSLLTDPKARKVIIVEHPLLPIYVKDTLARVLFENLQVPSVSFASSHLLSLLAVGRITGLVLDCGYLESVALPIFASRPLFPQIQTTPLAGSRLHSHLRSLLLLFGTYLPPTSPGPVNIPTASRSMRVPPEILTDDVIDEIQTRCCFVGEPLLSVSRSDTRNVTPGFEEGSEMDLPPSSDTTQSESDFSYAGRDSNVSSAQASTSDFSVISDPRTPAGADTPTGGLQGLANLYTRHSTATDLRLRVAPPLSGGGLGYATLIIPGWIRERTAEILFEPGDVDEKSVAEVILDALLKVPLDLRKTMASSILVIGGTSMLPGFIIRLHSELLRAIQPPPFTPRHAPVRPDRPPPPQHDRYSSLRPLTPYFAIVNNPSPEEPHSDRAKNNAGKGPAFTPATMAWLGASLAGALKTGGVEVSRENWDEIELEVGEDSTTGDSTMGDSTMGNKSTSAPSQSFHAVRDSLHQRNILPDWTRMPLSPGAPSAVARVGA